MNSHVLLWPAVISLAMSALAGVRADGPETRKVHLPEGVQTSTWVEERGGKQMREGVLRSRHNFQFRDAQPESGIDFLHRIVDDAGLQYRAAHYDHGSAVAVADVDNDGLPDVLLVNQAGPNGLYRNKGNGTFEDITTRAGIGLAQDIGVAASFADIDNDGDADLYLTHVRSPNRLFENLGDGRFKDISDASGTNIMGHSSGAIFFDYDRDGKLDLFVTMVGEYTTDQRRRVSGTPKIEALKEPPSYYLAHRDAFAGHLKPERSRASRLFRNQGKNRFVDVTEQTGLVDNGWSGDATSADFNRDGGPDLYVLNMQGDDEYWLNVEGREFKRAGHIMFPATPWGAMGVKSLDYNNDGHMDLMITDMHSDMSETLPPMSAKDRREKQKAIWIEKNWAPRFLATSGESIWGNALYRNMGNGSFEEVSELTNTENYWPWGLSAGDLNADGFQDLFIATSMNYPFRYAPNSVLLNHQGQTFEDAEYALGVEPRRDGRTSKPWFELDCERANAGHPLCQQYSGQLTVHGALGSRSSVMVDLDGDGDLDIVTSEFGGKPQVLISSLSDAEGKLSYLKVQLEGTSANRDGLGARVDLIDGDQRWTQVVDGKSGHLGFSRLPLYFGLEGSTPSLARVDWPDGTREQFSIPALNRVLILRQGQGRKADHRAP